MVLSKVEQCNKKSEDVLDQKRGKPLKQSVILQLQVLKQNRNFQEFNKWLGLPLDKFGYEKLLLPFHIELRDRIRKHKHTIINKFTGAAMTEIIPRIMLEMMLLDQPYLKQFAFVTGIRMQLTVQIMESRIIPIIKRYHPDLIKKWNKVEAKLELKSGHYFQGYPTENIDSIRGQDDIYFIFIDEAPFFPQTDQERVFNAISRYDLKTDPYIDWNGTPNGPQGGYYNLWQGAIKNENDYDPILLPYTLGLGTLLDPAKVEEEKRLHPRMFEQEYNNKFVAPLGSIFPELVESSTLKEETL